MARFHAAMAIGAALALGFGWLLLTPSLGASCPGTIVLASWYERGHTTASGERFRPDGHSIALRSRDFGRRYHLTNLKNGRSVIVRHNDFGPARWTGRSADLSRGAAKTLGMRHAGGARLCMRKLT